MEMTIRERIEKTRELTAQILPLWEGLLAKDISDEITTAITCLMGGEEILKAELGKILVQEADTTR